MLVDDCEGFWLARGPLDVRGYWVVVIMTGGRDGRDMVWDDSFVDCHHHNKCTMTVVEAQ
jgi:hypothetical protein